MSDTTATRTRADFVTTFMPLLQEFDDVIFGEHLSDNFQGFYIPLKCRGDSRIASPFLKLR